MRVHGLLEDIEEWCKLNNITATKTHPVINPMTFAAEYFWVIADEKERVMFMLKWRK